MGRWRYRNIISKFGYYERYIKWLRAGFLLIAVLGNIYRGFDYRILGLYILVGLLSLSWIINIKHRKF